MTPCFANSALVHVRAAHLRRGAKGHLALPVRYGLIDSPQGPALIDTGYDRALFSDAELGCRRSLPLRTYAATFAPELLPAGQTEAFLSRHGLREKTLAKEAGGLSGRPLFRRSTVTLAKMRLRVGRRLPIVGVGGIDSPETAWEKIVAGADLLQVYSGLVYEGPSLVGRILDHFVQRMTHDGVASLADLVGRHAERWAASDPEL